MTMNEQVEDRPEGYYYTGPIRPALDMLRESGLMVSASVKGGVFRAETVMTFGRGPDLETALRHMLGEEFSPVVD